MTDELPAEWQGTPDDPPRHHRPAVKMQPVASGVAAYDPTNSDAYVYVDELAELPDAEPA